MLVVGVEVEDALNEVLAEHFWALLQQQVQETVFTQANTRNSRCDVTTHTYLFAESDGGRFTWKWQEQGLPGPS